VPAVLVVALYLANLLVLLLDLQVVGFCCH
jgi:hypothetical protein